MSFQPASDPPGPRLHPQQERRDLRPVVHGKPAGHLHARRDAPVQGDEHRQLRQQRLRHLLTVARLNPKRWARALVFSFGVWSSARTRGVVRLSREDCLP